MPDDSEFGVTMGIALLVLGAELKISDPKGVCPWELAMFNDAVLRGDDRLHGLDADDEDKLEL